MTGRDVNGRDGLSGRRRGGRCPASRPVRAVTGDSRAGIQAAYAAGARSIGYAAAAASAGHLPVAGADAVIFRMAGLHSGCKRAPATRRPEVEAFRSARRTSAICGSPPDRPGESGVPWPPGRHCAEPAAGTTRRSMTSSPGWREPAAFWQPAGTGDRQSRCGLQRRMQTQRSANFAT